MDKEAILNRVLKRIPMDDAVDIIKEKFEGWVPEKKPRKKDDIKEKFLSISAIIRDEEIEDFVQMAVMKKSVGLPAYTYQLRNIDFLNGLNEGSFREKYQCKDQVYKEIFTISTELMSYDEEIIEVKFRLKEYEASWKTGVRNINSLSAVYTSNVIINRVQKRVTLFCGNHQVQEVLTGYISSTFSWPIYSYRVNEQYNQVVELGNVSFKTAILLDLITNRLTEKGIQANFKEIKFFTASKGNKDGIKDVAIGGKALLASQLACEYITTGSHVIYFKTGMVYEDSEFTTKVYLKGSNLDVIKIVILDTDDDELKYRAMEIIQEEYVGMCNSGIKDMEKTKLLLTTIADRYFKKDQLITDAIKENTLNSVSAICDLLEKLNEEDPEVLETLKGFTRYNRTILDSIGVDDYETTFERLSEFVGIVDVDLVDEDDYEDVSNEDLGE